MLLLIIEGVFRRPRTTLYSNQLFNINARTSYDTETDDVSAFIGVSFDMNYNPLSKSYELGKNKHISRGSLIPNIYYDENASGTFDDGETRLSGVDLKINEQLFSLEDNQYITNLNPYQKLNITVDDSSLSDPFTASKSDYFKVRTRPGVKTTLDIPVVNTGEVNGQVAFLDKNGQRKESGVQVNLLHCKKDHIIKTTRTYPDGVYLIESVKPGCYRLAISKQQMKALGYVSPSPIGITISKSGGNMTANNILIRGDLKKKGSQ